MSEIQITALVQHIDEVRTAALNMFEGDLAPVAAQAVRQGLLSAKENVVLASAAETPELARAYATLAADDVVNAIQVYWKLRHKGVTEVGDAQDQVLAIAGMVRYLY